MSQKTTEDDNTTRVRGADWIFTALWAACGEKNIPRCGVNIPITFIFRDGSPIKSLTTNPESGLVERIDLNSAEHLERQRGEKGLQGESMKLLRVLRKLLLQFSEERDYGDHQPSHQDTGQHKDLKLCHVCYTDGEVEDLTLSAFDRLIRSETWRLQVLLVQGYVPVLSQHDGFYSDKPKIRSKLVTDGAEAASQFTRALALYAEKAFETSEPLVYGSDSFATNTKIKIKEFQSHFVSDPQGRLIFHGSKYLLLAIVGNRKELEHTLENEKRSRELTAAKSVASELKNLLQHGQQRGLSVEMIFQHFDVSGCGFIDLAMLMNGLTKLGIGVTQPVGELLMQIIGGVGTNFLSLRDLQRFITEIDLEVFDRVDEDSSSGDKKAGHTATATGHQPRLRSIQSVKSLREEVESQQLQQESMFSTDSREGGGRKAKRSRSSHRTEDKVAAFPSHSTLPAPEDSYRVNAPPKEAATTLPPWATKRQKRALRDLNRSQSEWNKKTAAAAPHPNSLAASHANPAMRSAASGTLEIGERHFDLDDGDDMAESGEAEGSQPSRVSSRGASRKGSRGVDAKETSSILQSSLKELTLQQYALLEGEGDVKSCPDDMLHVDHGVMMTYRVLKGSGTRALDQRAAARAGASTGATGSGESYSLKYRSILEERERKMRASCGDEETLQSLYGELSTKDLNLDGVEKEGSELKRWISFTLVVVPDLFMCLQTLEKYLSPLLFRYPLARLVLVGLPGLPHTHWPRGWVINADLHSKSIATLLSHLKTTAPSSHNWSPVEDEPVLFLGFGSGVYSLSKFLVNYLPSLTWLPRAQVKAVIQVNGYQKLTKNYKRICKELRESLMTTTSPVEINELISSLHFWDEFLNQPSAAAASASGAGAGHREEVMREFWSTRKGLVERDKGLTLGTGTGGGGGGTVYSGVLEQLRGILIGPDDPDLQAKYLALQIPLLVIHSTENIFQDPHPVLQFYTQHNLQTNYRRQLLPSVSLRDKDIATEQLFDSQFLANGSSVSLSWVRAGHEVLQERSSFILAVVSKMAQLLGIQPTEKPAAPLESDFKNPYDDLDLERLIEEKLLKGQQQGPGSGEEEREGEREQLQEKVEGTLNLWKRKVRTGGEDEDEIVIEEYVPKEARGSSGEEGEGEGEEEGEEGGEEGDDVAALNQRARDEKKRKEKERRKTLVTNRKKRELEQETNDEKLFLKKQQEKLKELKREKKELLKMRKEDERSLYAEEYLFEVEQSRRNQEKAKLRTDELFQLRREEAMRQVEERLVKERAVKLEERRVKADKITKQIESEQLSMEGEKSGGYNLEYDDIIQRNAKKISSSSSAAAAAVEGGGGGGAGAGGYSLLELDSINLNLFIASTQRLLMDITECKNKLIEAIKRQALIEQKTLQYRVQKQGLDYEIRRLRQAIQLLKQQKLMKGMGITNSEKRELEENLQQKEETYREFCMFNKIREEQLQACNRNVQQLKLSLTEREGLMRTRILNLERLEKYYSLFIRQYKLELEDVIISKDLERNKKVFINERLEHLRFERTRLMSHKQLYVDSDVLVPGLLQRCVTKDLKKYLKKEFLSEEAKLQSIDESIDNCNSKIEVLATKQEKLVRSYNKLSLALRIFSRVYINKISKQNLSQILSEVNDKTLLAEKIESKKQNDLRNSHLLQSGTGGGAGAGEEEGSLLRSDGSASIAHVIRNKSHEIRTRDERKFIGIDMVLHPDHYRQHISTTELEEMRYDPDYQIDLEATDIQRILKLPEPINLALPFLSTSDEVEGHRLCNKYYRGKGDEFYRKADFLSSEEIPTAVLPANASTSAAGSASVLGSLGQNIYLSPEEMRQAEVIHEILMKEIRRDRVRSLAAGEEYSLSAEEKLWLSMDRILSPYVYGELSQGPPPRPSSSAVDADRPDDPDQFSTAIAPHDSSPAPALSLGPSSAVLSATAQSYELNGKFDGDDLRYITRPKHNHDRPVDGDKYQEMRWAYENGEIIFHGNEHHCSLSREELLALRLLPVTELTEEQLRYRALLDKFYVHEDESLYGQSRLETLLEVTREMYSFIHEQDNLIETAEAEALAGHGGALRGRGRGRTRTLSNVEGGDGNGEAESEDSSAIHRIFGSWEVTHPASAGMDSQNSFFQISTYSAARDHPAAYAIRKPAEEHSLFEMFNAHLAEEEEGHGSEDLAGDGEDIAITARIDEGVQSLLAGPTGKRGGGRGRRGSMVTSSPGQSSQYLIVESTKVLAQQDPKSVTGKIVLITSPSPLTLFEISNQELAARQSRAHQFEIPEKDNMRVLEVTVSILFQGSFGHRGYKLGRLAAALYRLPSATSGSAQGPRGKGGGSGAASPLPQAVGYAPYKLQSPNLPDQMGRIILLHKPKAKPISSGVFQIILGAGATCKYSIEVTCKYAQNALAVIDPLIESAKRSQSRLPMCLKELEELHTGLRLAERKLLVVGKMITEAEIETVKCQRNISLITEKLNHDDVVMEYTEDERRDLVNEQSIQEIEFATWASTYASRCHEKDDIYQGIAMMHRFQRERQEEKTKLKEELSELRRDLPSCIGLLRTYQEAANVAISLNTTVQGRIAANTETTAYSSSSTNTSFRIQTPADVVRRRYQRDGWGSLSLEEQQWTMLDRALCPHKYEWLTEKEEEENFRRLEMGKKPKKKKKYNLAIEQYRLSKVDIGRILAQPFAMLSRHEMNVRKLLTKYHDDPEVIKRNRNVALFNFDPRRAERTRSKPYAAMSKEEREWASVDKVLHPEVWAYYHHDDDAKAWLDLKGKDALLVNNRKSSMIGGGSVADRLKKSRESKANGPSSASPSAAASASASQGSTEDASSSELVNSLTRILDPGSGAGTGSSANPNPSQVIQNEAKHRKGSNGLQDIVSEVHKTLPSQGAGGTRNTGNWRNPFPQDQLLRIWKTPNPQLLKSDEERYVYRLLHKYNGSYGAYAELALQAKQRKVNSTKLGAHVRWDVHGLIVNPDIDGRAREILEELDRAIANKNFWMDSLVLHTNDQRFPTEVLRLQLEDALDTVLADQIRERERVDRMSATQKGHDDETSEEESSDSDDGQQQSPEDMTMSKVQARAARRDRRRLKAKQETLQQEVLVARRMILERNKTGEIIDESVLLKELGISGCLACRTPSCQWKASVDETACQARIKELNAELERVRGDPDQDVWYSTVALSTQLGGGTAFNRQDLLDELTYEVREIERRIHLNHIDKELHDCYQTRNEYVEVKYLHGYSSVLWTNNARKALNARQERLIAMNISQEIVDDILDYMLEGWYFGERESNYHLIGYVPSVKKDGFMHAGQEQVQAVGLSVAKAKQRYENKLKGIVSFEAMRGELEEKLMPIEMKKQQRLEDKRIAKEGTDYHHRLNETEQTLKFGLFMLTFMYFRAMAFVKREQRSWSGADDAVDEKNLHGKNKKEMIMTEERRKMLDEESKLQARQKKMDIILGRAREGEARKRDREANERREAIQRLQEIVRRQRREKEAINHIQRFYRGHLGRKAAKRWAMKRAEMTAINALLNAAAVCLQRVWRGWLGRKEAKETRAEMAYFIALMRAQEAEQDEEEYWETHQWQRYKKNARNFLNEKFRAEHAYKTMGGRAYGADGFNEDDDEEEDENV